MFVLEKTQLPTRGEKPKLVKAYARLDTLMISRRGSITGQKQAASWQVLRQDKPDKLYNPPQPSSSIRLVRPVFVVSPPGPTKKCK